VPIDGLNKMKIVELFLVLALASGTLLCSNGTTCPEHYTCCEQSGVTSCCIEGS
jgi:hypothetical protein